VGYAPGGGGDVLARAFAAELSKSLGQPVIVDNRPGANGMIALAQLAKSAPDGYTLGVANPFDITAALLYEGEMQYDIEKDFAPVAPMATTPLFLVVTPSLGVSNVQELVALAKSKPGALNFGTGGVGAPNHMFMELLNYKTGAKMTHVPYKGGAQSSAAVVSGEVAATWVSGPQGLPLIRAERLKPLAVSSAVRSSVLPDVPTMTESGVSGFALDTWFGIQAPAATPRAIVELLNAEITRIAKSPEMLERIEKSGSVPLYASPEQFAAIFAREAALWRDLLKNVEIKALR
jgi:tripartite-type tricarboxylate transporter receptor subunit TctC